MEETMEKKLIEYIKDFQLVDLFGFARIVGAQEQEDFEDYVTEVVMKYLELPRKDRKNLLKIAKQVSENNREYDRLKQEGKIKQRGLREKYPSIDDAAELNYDEWLNRNYDKAWKCCNTCKKELLRDPRNFVRKAKALDGLTNCCKKCNKEERKKRK